MDEGKVSTMYPNVKGEEETLDQVLAGKSIARYGDGEFNLVRGGNCVSQIADEAMQAELRAILKAPHKDCIVGIPCLDHRGPKFKNWSKYQSVYSPHLNPKVTYYSAFITRPDSAPWINTEAFFDKVESLWAGKHVVMVYGSDRSLSAQFRAMKSAADITIIPCPRRDAYAVVDSLEDQILDTQPNTVLLMCGPTATVLANRLAPKKHAIDLGHIGMFWRLYERGLHVDYGTPIAG